MNTFRIKAYAKINLGLDVLRRRPDGYHEVKMIMQTVDLYDDLEFTKLAEDEIRIFTDKEELPADQGNLIWRAAARMKELYQISEGVSVKLTKRIPIAAGMAGGSADAAATIHAMDALFCLGLSLEEKQKIGVKLGADIPYCLMGGTALSEGIGEILTKLTDVPKAKLVIAKPDLDVSTKFVYGNLHLDEVTDHPDIDGMVQAIRNHDLYGITDRMGNVLESVTCPAYPVIDEIKAQMMKNGAVNAMMSGSGPTVFGIFDDPDKAEFARDQLKISGLSKQTFLTTVSKPGGTKYGKK